MVLVVTANEENASDKKKKKKKKKMVALFHIRGKQDLQQKMSTIKINQLP